MASIVITVLLLQENEIQKRKKGKSCNSSLLRRLDLRISKRLSVSYPFVQCTCGNHTLKMKTKARFSLSSICIDDPRSVSINRVCIFRPHEIETTKKKQWRNPSVTWLIFQLICKENGRAWRARTNNSPCITNFWYVCAMQGRLIII